MHFTKMGAPISESDSRRWCRQMKQEMIKGLELYSTLVAKMVGIFFMISAVVTLVPAALIACKSQSDAKALLLFVMLGASALIGGIGYAVFRFLPVAFHKVLGSIFTAQNRNTTSDNKTN